MSRAQDILKKMQGGGAASVAPSAPAVQPQTPSTPVVATPAKESENRTQDILAKMQGGSADSGVTAPVVTVPPAETPNMPVEDNAFAEKYATYLNESGIPDNETRHVNMGKMKQERFEEVYKAYDHYMQGVDVKPLEGSDYATAEDAIKAYERMKKLYGDILPVWAYNEFNFFTDEEKDVYYALLDKYGADKANEYYSFMSNNVAKQREGAAEAESMKNSSFVGNFLDSVETGIMGGVRNIAQTFKEDAIPKQASDYAHQALVEDSTGLERYVYQAGSTIGNQVPSLLLSGAGTVSLLMSGVNAKGAAYADALERGYSKAEANVYSALIGASEFAVSKLLGGIGNVSGLGEEALLGVSQKIGNAALRTVAQLGIRTGSEIAEEEVQAFLEPAIEALVLNVPYDAPNFDELLETAIVTALSTGITEGVSTVSTNVKAAIDNKKAQTTPQTAKTVDAAEPAQTPDALQQALFGQQNQQSNVQTQQTAPVEQTVTIPVEGQQVQQSPAEMHLPVEGSPAAERVNPETVTIPVENETAASNVETTGESEENTRLSESDLAEYLTVGVREHVRNQKHRILADGGNPILTKISEIVDFLKNSFSGKIQNEIKAYGKVGGRMAADVRQFQNSGVDIDGYYLELDANHLRHLSDHINDDGDPRNAPLTDEQALQLPEYIDGYDDVLEIKRYKDGGIRITLGKKINGHAVVVELVSKGRRSIHPVTAWKNTTEHYLKKYKKKAGAANTSLPGSTAGHSGYKAIPASDGSAVSTMGLTAKPSSNLNIPQSAQNSNTQNADSSVGAAPGGFDPLTGAEIEYGTQVNERNEVRDSAMPVSTDGTDRVSQMAVSAKGAAVTTDEMADLIGKSVMDKSTPSGLRYVPIDNGTTMQKAQDSVIRNGWEQSLADWQETVRKGVVNERTTAMGILLYNNAVNAGNTRLALSILSDLSSSVRDAARGLQVVRVLRETSPSNRLYMIEAAVQRLNEQQRESPRRRRQGSTEHSDIAIPEDLAEKYLAAETEAERDAIIEEMQKRIGSQMHATLADKWRSMRMMNMLGNFKTQIRNLAGNVGMRAVAEVKNALKSTIEKAAKVLGGKVEQTSSVFVGKDLMAAAQADFETVKSVAMEGGRTNENMDSNAFIRAAQEHMPIWRGNNAVTKAVATAAEAYRKATNWLMNNQYFGDEGFLKSAYTRFLGGYLKANGVTAEQFNSAEWQNENEELVSKARAYALQQAQEVTFRDKNWLSDTAAKIGRGKNTPGAVKAIAEGIQPFRRTPANVLVRAEQYSPLGFFNAAINAAKAKNGGVNANGDTITSSDVVESLAKATTGTGIFVIGILLAASGRLVGGADDDEKQKAFDDLTGRQEYALVLKDGTSITMDWLSPLSMPLFMGAELGQAAREGGISWDVLPDILGAMSDAYLEMSMMSGINDAIESGKFSDGSALPQILATASLDFLLQGVTNTLVGQVMRSVGDESLMAYPDKDSPIPSFLQKEIASASRKLSPDGVWSAPYIDAWGRTESNGDNFFERLVQNAINPSFVSNETKDEVETELQRLYDSVGKAEGITVFPTRADKSFEVDGETYHLSAEEYVTYATAKGQLSRSYVEEALSSPEFQAMSVLDQAYFIADVLSVANYMAKKQTVPEYESSTYAQYDEAAAFGLTPAQWYVMKKQFGTQSTPKQTVQGTDSETGEKVSKTFTDEEWAAHTAETMAKQMAVASAVMGLDAYKNGSEEFRYHLIDRADDYVAQVMKAEVLGTACVDKWVQKTLAAQESVGLSPAVVLYYKQMVSDKNDTLSDSEVEEYVLRTLFEDNSLTPEQKKAVSKIVISSIIAVPRDLDVDFTNKETFTVSQMTDSQQGKWPAVKEAGMSYEEYVRMFDVADLNGAGGLSQAEVEQYLDNQGGKYTQEQKSKIWAAVTGGKAANNPYGNDGEPSKTSSSSGDKTTSTSSSTTGKTDTSSKKEYAADDLTQLGSDAQKNWEKATAAGTASVTNPTEFIKMTNGADYNGNKSVSNSEAEIYLRGLGDKYTQEEKATLWFILTGGAERNNPFL